MTFRSSMFPTRTRLFFFAFLMSLFSTILKRNSLKLFSNPIVRVNLERPLERGGTNEAYANVKQSSTATSRNMHIQSIPMCMVTLNGVEKCINRRIGEGTGNNYAYLVTDDNTKDSVIIDPANPPEYVSICTAFSTD